MAVEKLILRSILYGADKIPDSWFEKLPGGYYRDADGHKRKIGDKNPKKDSPKPTSKGRKAGSSDFYPDRNYSERDHLERGRQRDRDRDRERRTSSYDGGADDADEDFYYYREDGRPHRSKSYRRRRSAERDRHGHKDGSPRERFHEDRHRGAPSPSPREPGMGRRYPTAYIERPSVYVQPPYFEAEAAAQTPQYLRRNYTEPAPEQRSPSQIYRNGPINNGYVPYAHVYGTARQAVPRPEPSPGAFFEDSDLRSRRSPIAPYPQRYQQTRSNQQAPVGAAEHGAQSASNLRNARIVDGPEALHSYRYAENGLLELSIP